MSIDRLLGPGGAEDITDIFMGHFQNEGLPFLLRAVVLDVLFDPVAITPELAEELRDRHDSELFLLEQAPRGSIICCPVRRGGEIVCEPIVCFPFNPHHIPPIKAGEQCWIVHENDKDPRQYGFWMHRIVEPRTVDDPNFTHADRKFVEPAKLINSKAIAAGMGGEPVDPIPAFLNGIGSDESFSLHSDGDLKNPYDAISEESEAAKLHKTEPVPRFRSRPGDHVIQGSSNTLIVLGEDRVGPPAERDQDSKVVGKPATDQPEKAGSIDLVVGRGQAEATSPLEITNTREQLETDKNPAVSQLEEKLEEGDPDPVFDLSRILLAMSTKADTNFKLPFVSDSEEVSSAIIQRTGQIRLVARKDIKIMVVPEEAVQEDGTVDETLASVIMVKTDGTIVLIPSQLGVIKLGGEEADKALLCTTIPAGVVGGSVISGPIATTGGDLVGLSRTGAPDQGTFAAKVLVVG